MKVFIGCVFLCFATTIFAQQEIKFYAQVSNDSIHVDDIFEFSFIVEGDELHNFEMPQFDQFIPVSGPNRSSQITFINGKMSQTNSLAYQFTPKSSGIFLIGPASITIDGKKMETEAVRIEVYGTSSGIKKGPPSTPPKIPGKKSKKGPVLRI